ncbi:hypothetical protein [Streptomyces sp. NPDC053560]|uniref:hypothetical protein n=1 Tax=Streptomyces sp. NPDC053560 TaxID=3365711 RepID=UPI0037D3A42E
MRTLCLAVYASGYLLAVWNGATAIDAGRDDTAVALFLLAAALLLAMRREYRHAAQQASTASPYRALGFPAPADAAARDELAAVEKAVADAVPPGCTCSVWWSTLGARHGPRCLARAGKDSP